MSRVRKISMGHTGGAVTTLAGCGVAGFRDGPGKLAQFNEPQGIAVTPCGTVFVADSGNHRIRYGTFRLNFHRFDRFELDLRGHTQVWGAALSCLHLKWADMVLI